MTNSTYDDIKSHLNPKRKDSKELLSSFQDLMHYLNQMVIGQEELIKSLMVALLADGHLLVEGAPGLAKTRAIKILCSGIESSFHRLQFTPDLLPADLTGTEIFKAEIAQFEFQKGPIFHNLILADEINRAPAKVQAALLEAMAERQVTVGKQTYSLPKLFLVMATQNPIEQEGTYPLPEAQLDRFLLKVNVNYPDPKREIEILQLVLNEARHEKLNTPVLKHKLSQADLFHAREEALEIHLSQNIQHYIVQLVLATRDPSYYGRDLKEWVQFGASPRASIALARCAKASAFIEGKDYVGPEDVQALAHEVLRHRIILSYRAEAEGITSDLFINELLSRVPVP